MPAISNGERRLVEKVWNKHERAILWEDVGNDPDKFDADGKDRRARKHQRRVERRALKEKAALEGERTLGDWEDSRKAIVEAEEEIEVESTVEALSQTEIGPKQVWSGEVADRTR